MIITTILLLFILTLMVSVHELGHMIAAKAFGVYCQEYSIGIGPLLWKHQFKETQFSIRALPIGGFVKMAGEHDDGIESKGIKLDIPRERTLVGISKFKQFIVYTAGVFMNVVLAFVLCFFVYCNVGIITPSVINSNSELIKPGDEIVSVEGDKLVSNLDLELLTENLEEAEFVIDRGGEEIKLNVPCKDLKIDFEVQKLPIGYRIEAAFMLTKEFSTLIISSLRQLFTKEGITQVGGIISMYSLVEKNSTLVGLLALTAMLSINLAVVNYLPVPALDGGRVLILILEAIKGKSLSEKATKIAFLLSFIFIVLLFIWTTGLDVLRLFGLV